MKKLTVQNNLTRQWLCLWWAFLSLPARSWTPWAWHHQGRHEFPSTVSLGRMQLWQMWTDFSVGTHFSNGHGGRTAYNCFQGCVAGDFFGLTSYLSPFLSPYCSCLDPCGWERAFSLSFLLASVYAEKRLRGRHHFAEHPLPHSRSRQRNLHLHHPQISRSILWDLIMLWCVSGILCFGMGLNIIHSHIHLIIDLGLRGWLGLSCHLLEKRCTQESDGFLDSDDCQFSFQRCIAFQDYPLLIITRQKRSSQGDISLQIFQLELLRSKLRPQNVQNVRTSQKRILTFVGLLRALKQGSLGVGVFLFKANSTPVSSQQNIRIDRTTHSEYNWFSLCKASVTPWRTVYQC